MYGDSARNIAALAISISVPIFFSGTALKILFFSASVHVLFGGSRIAPGAMAFTRISGAKSLASYLVKVSRPDFAAKYIE